MQLAMVTNSSMTVQSRLLFAVLAVGCLVYAFVFVDLASRLPEGRLVFAVYALLGIGLVYITWSSTTVIVMCQDELLVMRLFGLGPSLRLPTRNIKRLLVRPDHHDQVSRVVIEFADGRRLQLHRYQSNFQAARQWLAEKLEAVPLEVQSKWAL